MALKALLSAVFLAIPALAVTHESLAAVPAGWKLSQQQPAADTQLSLSVALVHQNLDQLESKLLAVSTPGHPQYGQHLDADDITAQFPPVEATNVVAWLQSAGIPASSIHNTGSAVHFATTVGQANSLLQTNFAYYTDGGVEKLRTLSYSIPDNLVNDIDLISPTVYFGKSTASRTITSFRTKRDSATASQEQAASSVSVAASCQTSITPSCLQEMYSTGGYTPDAQSGSKVGFGSFLNETAIYSDLFLYEQIFGIPHQTFTVELINNGTNYQNSTNIGEANLDVQNIIGLSHPLPVVEFITGGSPPFIPDANTPTNTNEPYLPYYEYLLSQPNEALPQVISNSYGDDEQTVPENYARRVCNLIGLMGLRGISVLESSGDAGVGAVCLTNDGSNKPRFMPTFPATCPYVTSVGGTQAVTPEIAWVGSSGGFSDYFPRPWYQEIAVETYLARYVSEETKSYYSQFTNFSGRGFPDVSAHSLTPDFEIVYGGRIGPSGGTSAASPIVAAVLGLLNDARFRAHKPALGFLNPFLYLFGYNGLNDITGGQAYGCQGQIPGAFWNATPGWDPVTGFGTPNFEKMKAIALTF